MIKRAVFGLSVFSAAYATGATANTIHVCSTCAHTSIQSAVTDAASGDTIDIAAGRYIENITITGKALTLQGQSSGSTWVYAAGRGPVFTLGSGVAGASPLLITIGGLTIAHGNHSGGTGVGGGVQVRAGAYLHLQNSTLTENAANTGAGLGVDSPGAPATTVTGCLIDHNSTLANDAGGGVVAMPGSTVSIQDSFITRNSSGNGGGAFVWFGGTLDITGSTISGNISHAVATHYGLSGGGGGGIYARGALTLDSSYVNNNSADGEDGGGGLAIYVEATRNTVVSNTIIAQNSGGLGAGIVAYGGNLTLRTSYVVKNQGWGVTGIVTLSNDRSTVKDNELGDICVTNFCPQP